MNTTTEHIIKRNDDEIVLNFADYFAKEQFIKHVVSKYGEPHDNELLFLYSVRALELMIDYGIEHNNASKNQLAYFLFDLVPDVTFAEVVAYCDNYILTNNARIEKYDYWDTEGAEE